MACEPSFRNSTLQPLQRKNIKNGLYANALQVRVTNKCWHETHIAKDRTLSLDCDLNGRAP